MNVKNVSKSESIKLKFRFHYYALRTIEIEFYNYRSTYFELGAPQGDCRKKFCNWVQSTQNAHKVLSWVHCLVVQPEAYTRLTVDCWHSSNVFVFRVYSDRPQSRVNVIQKTGTHPILLHTETVETILLTKSVKTEHVHGGTVRTTICLWRRYINVTITILDIIHRPIFYLKLNSTL
jgi:hypothetical protein